jgi:adenosine deaminase
MTRSVPNLEAHPLPVMLEAGLLCTLASDDPSMFLSFLADEYALCRRAFGFDDERLAGLASNGVRASFAPEHLKRELEAGIRAWIAAEP